MPLGLSLCWHRSWNNGMRCMSFYNLILSYLIATHMMEITLRKVNCVVVRKSSAILFGHQLVQLCHSVVSHRTHYTNMNDGLIFHAWKKPLLTKICHWFPCIFHMKSLKAWQFNFVYVIISNFNSLMFQMWKLQIISQNYKYIIIFKSF